MKKPAELDSRLNILMSNDLRKRYKLFCITNDFRLSERVRFLLEQDIKLISNTKKENKEKA